MWEYSILCFILCCNATLSYAQSADTLSVDTIPAQSKKETYRPTVAGILIPTTMITYGVVSLESHALMQLDYSTKNELLEDHSMWYNGWDNYLQFSPAVAAFALKLSGVESKHKMSDMLVIYALSNVLETAFVYTTKSITPRERPDGSSANSFPSGHTATAFVAAEFLHQEYKDKSIWISIGGYGMASLIGISRIYNNRHWISDVVAGAGIGILSTKIVYWTYPYMQKLFSKKDSKHQALVLPTYDGRSLGFALSYTF